MIKQNMEWPPRNLLSHKCTEHSVWYSGMVELLLEFFKTQSASAVLSISTYSEKGFWGRQTAKRLRECMHIPIASDIAETSASFLFGSSPLIRFSADVSKDDVAVEDLTTDNDQTTLDEMLVKSGFFRKLLEAAETCSAIGGVFIKIVWDSDVSEYPIPMIVQPDKASPTFKLGMLSECDFVVDEFRAAETESAKLYRLVETYKRGSIETKLYLGTDSKIGEEVELTSRDETKDIEAVIQTGTDSLLAVYVPNLLPNRLSRSSYIGRSDLQGIESLMDALDEVFNAWLVDIKIARGKIHIPDAFIQDKKGDGKASFDIDETMYVALDVDPLSAPEIKATQFEIRADQFEKTCLNLLDRIITSAGYSPQSFGLNITGRAESGTALNIRERKSFSTTKKKQAYWEDALEKLIIGMCEVYQSQLSGKFICDITKINIAFVDCISNNIDSVCTAIKTLSDASAISIDTKVRMAHPEWSDGQVAKEISLIKEENSIGAVPTPEDNLDTAQLGNKDNQPNEAKATQDPDNLTFFKN